MIVMAYWHSYLVMVMFWIEGVRGQTKLTPDTATVNYTDFCRYNEGEGLYGSDVEKVKCGDACINSDGRSKCHCGKDIFTPYIVTQSDHSSADNNLHCCIKSNESCTRESWNTYCNDGMTIPMSSKCDNRCYNSYQNSEIIGSHSHYTCPSTCVSLTYEMCQGVNWCGSDVQECGPQLRCFYKNVKIDGKRSLDSKLAPSHQYCIFDFEDYSTITMKNTGIFELLDRSDEGNIVSSGTSYEIQPVQFPPCDYHDDGVGRSGDGLMCGSECMARSDFCHELSAKTCGTEAISTVDKRLCGNPTVFANRSCSVYNSRSGTLRWLGKKCIGTNQQCVRPWYMVKVGGGAPGEPQGTETCEDKSDQIFTANMTCREHLEDNFRFHDLHFCTDATSGGLAVNNFLICTNKTEWLSFQDKTLSDPHFCQSSCSNYSRTINGLDCVACTNPEYFNCTSSDTCLHPSLVCDGHPQCQGGEDENLDKCLDKYIKNKIIQAYSSLRCTSEFYENMQIYATPCDGHKECKGGKDEAGCKDNQITNTIVAVSMTTAFVMFIVLRIIKGVYKNSSSKDNPAVLFPPSTGELLEKFNTNIHGSEIVEQVNLYLWNSVHTQTVGENKKQLLMIFEFLASKHNLNEAEMYAYLHRCFDPKLVQKMVDVKYPGGIDALINAIQNLARRPIVFETKDFINSSGTAKTILENFVAIVKIELKLFDLVKDLGLSILMLNLVGGFRAIIDLPTNFGPVMVLTMFGSIFVPIMVSTLHLGWNNFNMFLPEMKVDQSSSKLKKFMKTTLLFLLSPVLPMILETHFLQTSEEARELSQNYNKAAVLKKQNCRNIRKQQIIFGRIELGMEVIVQVTVQSLIILLSQTKTPTTGGLTTVFSRDIFGVDAFTAFSLSISWSIVSFVRTHTNLIAIHKGFCKMSTRFFIFLWGAFATLRRILSLIAMFVPSLGIFSILHHWRWEQIPFKARMEYAKRGFLTPEDKIGLYGLDETIVWTDLDRWNYTNIHDPQPPPYSLYTLMSLRSTFTAAVVLAVVHFIALMIVKMWTSDEFSRRGHYVNKFIHLIENLNYATPYVDWDEVEDEHSIDQFRQRFKATWIEMAATFCVNIIFTAAMLVPLWHTAYQVNKRHEFLDWLLRVKEEEETSYNNVNSCVATVTTCVFIFSVLEILSYFLYLFQFHPWIKILQKGTIEVDKKPAPVPRDVTINLVRKSCKSDKIRKVEAESGKTVKETVTTDTDLEEIKKVKNTSTSESQKGAMSMTKLRDAKGHEDLL